MSGTDHKHPTFDVCVCGHLGFMHPWTSGERVDYQGGCTARKGSDPAMPEYTCECTKFHADPQTVSP